MNPYRELGVSETASQEEIRAAYRKLVKQYHPDKYTDERLKEQATEKIKRINEAYDMLTKNKDAGSSAYRDAGRSYSGSYSGEYASEFAKVERLINVGRYNEAMEMLDAMSIRNARWNYLYGVIALRMNKFDAASNFFETAYRMEPNNMEYSNAYNMTHMSRGSYSRTYTGNGTQNAGCCSCGDDECSWCSTLLCVNCLCNSCIRC